MLLPENRRRLPLEEQLHYLQSRLDEVSSGKHSIGQSRRAKALRKEISVIKRKLAHQREGGSGMGCRDSVSGGDRSSSLPHHSSSAGHHDEGGESSSQEIGGKGVSRNIITLMSDVKTIVTFAFQQQQNNKHLPVFLTFKPLSPSRSECVLICPDSRGGSSDICPLLQEEPKNVWTPKKARTSPQEQRSGLWRGRGEPKPHRSPTAPPAVAKQAEEEAPQPPHQLQFRQRQRQ